jgi:hypothetical protein
LAHDAKQAAWLLLVPSTSLTARLAPAGRLRGACCAGSISLPWLLMRTNQLGSS